jgi:hypothetical protein
VWDAFVKVNNLGGKVTTVPVQSDPSPLASGEIDGYVGFVTNEAVTMKVRGLDVRTLAFQDFGLPTLYETYVVQAGSLQDAKKRQQIKAVITGEIGSGAGRTRWPTRGRAVDLALNDFGKSLGLNRDQQTAQATGQNPLIVSADTDQHGLFWMTDAAISQSVQTAGGAGTPLKPALFTNEILAEIPMTWPARCRQPPRPHCPSSWGAAAAAGDHAPAGELASWRGSGGGGLVALAVAGVISARLGGSKPPAGCLSGSWLVARRVLALTCGASATFSLVARRVLALTCGASATFSVSYRMTSSGRGPARQLRAASLAGRRNG